MELADYKIIKWNGMEHVVTCKIVCLEVIEIWKLLKEGMERKTIYDFTIKPLTFHLSYLKN